MVDSPVSNTPIYLSLSLSLFALVHIYNNG
jgi:hypothetical protein